MGLTRQMPVLRRYHAYAECIQIVGLFSDFQWLSIHSFTSRAGLGAGVALAIRTQAAVATLPEYAECTQCDKLYCSNLLPPHFSVERDMAHYSAMIQVIKLI